jgi:hypothetical protein
MPTQLRLDTGLVELAGTAPAGAEGLGVEVVFEGADGGRRCPLSGCRDRQFEDAVPVRPFRWSRGQGHFPGWWWLATTGRHVGYESWLERDHLMLLDFDPAVTAVASQPFWLHWHDGRRSRRHAPDFFARLADGTAVVIDVRADDRIGPRDAETFEVTARSCESAGWEFRRVGIVDPVLAANVRWLSRYRHPRCAGRPGTPGALRRAFASPAPLLAGAAEAGDSLAVLPVLFHLLWRRELTADLGSGPLGPSTAVRVADAAR